MAGRSDHRYALLMVLSKLTNKFYWHVLIVMANQLYWHMTDQFYWYILIAMDDLLPFGISG